MIPILFSENSTTYTTNGIGRLSDAISCVVSEQRNGSYELEMQYPETGNHFADIGIRKIIVVKPAASASIQPFRIYKITKPINGKVTIYAQHLSYDLTKNTVMPFSVVASGSACNTTLQQIKANAVESCPFTFWTDVTTVASYTQQLPASIRSRLGGVEGSVLDQFGGEYEWDKYAVKLHKDRGVVSGVTLRYGKNITDIEQEENIANTVTGIVPFWTNVDKSETVILPEKVIYSSNASRYSTNLTVPVDFSSEWQEAPTVEQLRAKARAHVNTAGFGLPKVSIKLSFVNLADTEEYKDIIPLQQVKLCDTVNVQFEMLSISTTAKVVETEFDVLKEKYLSVQIGSLKSTLATTINDMNASMATAIEDTGARVYSEVNSDVGEMVDNATAWLTSSGGYVIAIKNSDGTWKELLFMDSNDVETAHNVLRINENGIGFSSTGVGGPYTQAWTLDGRLVIGGTNVPSLTVYDNHSNILFQASATGVKVNQGEITLRDGYGKIVFQASGSGVKVNKGEIVLRDSTDAIVFKASPAGIRWNATNSSMTEDGTLTITNATLRGGQLNLGGNRAGEIKMYDFDDVLAGVWNRSGMTLYKNDDGIREIMFQVNSRGAYLNGKFHAENASGRKYIDIYDEFIMFNDDSYFDFEGSGSAGGINCNSDKFIFSVDEIGVTESRGDTTIWTGYDGRAITALTYSSLNDICTDLSINGQSITWSSVDIEYVSGYETHKVVNGLVVD